MNQLAPMATRWALSFAALAINKPIPRLAGSTMRLKEVSRRLSRQRTYFSTKARAYMRNQLTAQGRRHQPPLYKVYEEYRLASAR